MISLSFRWVCYVLRRFNSLGGFRLTQDQLMQLCLKYGSEYWCWSARLVRTFEYISSSYLFIEVMFKYIHSRDNYNNFSMIHHQNCCVRLMKHVLLSCDNVMRDHWFYYSKQHVTCYKNRIVSICANDLGTEIWKCWLSIH